MEVTKVKTDGKARSTGPLMYHMVEKYHDDMLPYAHMSLEQVYDIIKNIPFRPDPAHEETLMRPRYTMTMQGWGGDCDDKSIALASWAYNRGGRPNKKGIAPGAYDYRFIACRRPGRNVLHHVYPQLYIKNSSDDGWWVPADATYAFNVLGREHGEYVERVVI